MLGGRTPEAWHVYPRFRFGRLAVLVMALSVGPRIPATPTVQRPIQPGGRRSHRLEPLRVRVELATCFWASLDCSWGFKGPLVLQGRLPHLWVTAFPLSSRWQLHDCLKPPLVSLRQQR